MNIIVYIIIALDTVIGLTSTLAFIVMFFGTIGYKVYRKARYGLSFYD